MDTVLQIKKKKFFSINCFHTALRLFKKGQLGANVLGANQINYNEFIIQTILVVLTEKNQNALIFVDNNNMSSVA